MPIVSLRAATPEDAPVVAGLITERGYPTSVDAMRARVDRRLAAVDHATFAAEAAGRVVGPRPWFLRRRDVGGQ